MQAPTCDGEEGGAHEGHHSSEAEDHDELDQRRRELRAPLLVLRHDDVNLWPYYNYSTTFYHQKDRRTEGALRAATENI